MVNYVCMCTMGQFDLRMQYLSQSTSTLPLTSNKGILSPLMWILVAGKLLTQLSMADIECQYAFQRTYHSSYSLVT